jgi:Phage integrase family
MPGIFADGFRASMVARTGTLRAKREYSFEHVPSYRSNPAQPYDRRLSDVERTNGSQRLSVLCRIRSYFRPHRTQCSSIPTAFTPRFLAVQHHSCGKLVIMFDKALGRPMGAGTPLSGGNLNRAFKALLKRAGLPQTIRFHDLRHTCATLLLRQGVNPKIVQDLLGHGDVSLTLNVYSHVLPDMGDTAAYAMDDALG